MKPSSVGGPMVVGLSNNFTNKKFGKRHEVLSAGAIVNVIFHGFVGFELAPEIFFL